MSVYIQDTSTNANNNSVVETDVINSGGSLELYSPNVTFSQSSILDKSEARRYKDNDDTLRYTFVRPKHNGVNIPTINVNCRILKSDTTYLNKVLDLINTKGVKKLYCDLAQLRGRAYFNVVIDSVNINDSWTDSTNYFSADLSFVEHN